MTGEAGGGNDVLYGGIGRDTLYGGGDDDQLYGGAGNDLLYGGAGNDLALYADETSAVTVDLSTGTASGTSTGTDSLATIENVQGSAFNDLITGDGNANTLIGGYGIDVVYGRGGADLLIGDLPTDPQTTIPGGAASNADTLHGGAGDDTIWGDDIGDSVGESGGGNDVLFGGADNDTLYGGGDNDSLFGDAGNDVAYGGIGNDVGDGDIGNDTLVGDDGQDALWGGAGGDTVYGGLDADVIYGGEFGAPGDVNRIYGGGGADVLYVSQDDGTDYYYGGGDGRNDKLVLFGRFAEAGDTIAGDWFKAGTGVSEHDGATIAVGTALGSSSDSDVTIVYGGSVTLTNDVTGARVIFSTADVQTITLWNSDAGGPNNYQEVFEWNGSAYTFAHFA